MATYNVMVSEMLEKEVVLKIGFGDPASNDQIVKDAKEAIGNVKDSVMGKLVKINGPASLPVAFVLAHELVHIVPAIAVFDPKLGGYVVSVSHSADYRLGDIL